MKFVKTAITIAGFLALTACATISEKMKMSKGVSATECFSSGGTIDTSSGSSMCVMGEGESKPIL